MMSKATAVETARDLYPEWHANREEVERLDKWYRGDNDAPKLPATATDEYKGLRDRSPTPWLNLIVTEVAQAMYVDGIRRPQAAHDSPQWRIWQANGMDARQVAIHRGCLAHALSYVVVLPGELRGEPMPKARGVSARKMLAVYADPAEDEWPMHALRGEVSGGQMMWRLYDEDAVHFISSSKEGGDWTYISHEVHGAGVTPVVRFANQLDLDGRSTGEVGPFIPLAARIDQDTFDRLVVQRFGAWKVRTIAGMEEPDTDEKKRAAAIALRIEDLLVSDNPDTKFGTLDETPLKGFIEARDADIRDLAAVSQTPEHSMLGRLVNISADALVAAKDGLNRKVEERKHSFGESHEQWLRLGALYLGDEESAYDFESQVVWRDMESRSLAHAADALGKLAQMLDVPVQMLWRRIPGWTQQDTEEAERLAAENDAMGQLLSALANQAEPNLPELDAPAL